MCELTLAWCLPGGVLPVHYVDVVIRLLSGILARIEVAIVSHATGDGAVNPFLAVDKVVAVCITGVSPGWGRWRDRRA